MPGGAAAAAAGGGLAGRSRPPAPAALCQHLDGLPRYVGGLYSLFPASVAGQQRQPPAFQKVSESLFSCVSAFGVPAPPPPAAGAYSPFQLELLKSYSHQVLLEQKRDVLGKMDDPKLAKQCLSDSVTCCGLGNDAQRQMLENVTSIMQPLTIKTENMKRSCNTCITASPKKVIHGLDTGCSRTNPIAWTTMGMAGQNVHVQVKREPHAQHMQMSDLVAVKLEQSSPGTKHDQSHATIPASLNNGTIPVGIAVARQRVGDAGLLAALSTHKDQQHRLHDIEAAAMTVGVSAVGGALLHCEERAANQLPGWPVTSHAPPPPPALAPPPTLWQYPAQMSMDSMMLSGMGGVGGMGSVAGIGTGGGGGGGYQLVREPASGALLLLPTPPEQYPQAVLWGGYPGAPLLLPPQPQQPPLQLLSGCGDLLASATLHQHTQTHSTRLVALAAAPPPQHAPPSDKRKPLLNLLAPHALIKIEAEPPPPDKPPHQYAPEPPLLAAHLYYQPQPQPPFVHIAQADSCREQATSPRAFITPPPPDAPSEALPPPPAHCDASNQTDAMPDDDDDSPNHADDDERDVACVGVASSALSEEDSGDSSSCGGGERPDEPPRPAVVSSPSGEQPCAATVVESGAADKAVSMERDDLLTDNNSSSISSHDLVIDSGRASPISQKEAVAERQSVDVSGLELLSNSIEQFETRAGAAATPGADMPPLETPVMPLTVDTRVPHGIVIKTSPKSPPRSVDVDRRRFEFPSLPQVEEPRKAASLDGLGLLCALAEQRFMEEVDDGSSTSTPTPPRVHVKSEPPALLSPRDSYGNLPPKKERRKTRDGESPDRSDRKRHHDDDRSKYKFEKIRRHREDRNRETKAEKDGTESYRRTAACGCGSGACPHEPIAADLANVMERDLRDRLADLQRQVDEKRAQLDALDPCAPSPTSSQSSPSPVDCSGSSKKRKVGRPKKMSSPDSTETIVAKKPKSKSSLVGYLLAAKSRLNMPSKGGIIYSKGEDPSRARTSKVRPKLKAEPKVKEYSEEEDTEWGSQSSLARSGSSSMESLHEVRLKNREKTDRIALKHGQTEVSELEFATSRASSDGERNKRRPSAKSPVAAGSGAQQGAGAGAVAECRCTLTEEALESGPRVLTARGGLFYAGRLSAVRAPDLYAVTLDGERGNKPHILSREETLRDAILEVTPSSTQELKPGTRLCAYWSQQYRCLYPGTAAHATPEPDLDARFVSVEFDDGDSGRIALEDIRLLEPNYPVVEYDPNPLLTLGKRRRNTSVNSTEDKKSNLPSQTVDQPKPSTSEPATVTGHKTSTERSHSESEDKHRDRKKLKKHRKEKLKKLMSGSHDENPESLDYVKKKKKKHKCYDEHCKHRKHHKKHHRKHRKRHHSSCKELSSSSGDDQHRHKSSSECLDSNRSNEDSYDSNDQISTLVAMEKSPAEDMKTVIKKTVVSKKSLVKNAVLDFSSSLKKEAQGESSVKKDNLKDSGIGMEVEGEGVSPTDANKKKSKKRTVSSTSSEGGAGSSVGVSKMAAFLPGGALWSWHGAAYRRVAARPRHRKLFYRAIQRGDEVLKVGDAAVFLSTGRPDRPYIGHIVSLWEARGAAMAVKVKWFYHPEETTGFQNTLKYPGGLFESPHTDENDVQTISHKCEVLPLPQYKERMGDDPQRYSSVYDNNDLYYLVGHYDPTQQTIKMQPEIPFAEA